MKTLILNGSPRKNGDTAQLLELAKAQLQGTYHVVAAYTADIHPCIDCRHCQKQFVVSLQTKWKQFIRT